MNILTIVNQKSPLLNICQIQKRVTPIVGSDCLTRGHFQVVQTKTLLTTPSANSVIPPPPPPNKKTKCESPSSESPNILDNTQITPDDGDDLIPLMSHGPNVFYGFSDALFDFFRYAENDGPYWLKSMVMDQYKTRGDQDDDDPELLPYYAGITCDPENLQTPEAKLLRTHFDGFSNTWWYEVTLKRQEPEGMRLRVMLESSRYDPEGSIRR